MRGLRLCRKLRRRNDEGWEVIRVVCKFGGCLGFKEDDENLKTLVL